MLGNLPLHAVGRLPAPALSSQPAQQHEAPRPRPLVVDLSPSPVELAPRRLGVSKIFRTSSSKAWSTATLPLALVSTSSAPCFLANAMPSALDTWRLSPCSKGVFVLGVES